MFDGYTLPAAADFHVHLRDGAMMEAVTPTIRRGGVDTVFVMVSPKSILSVSFLLWPWHLKTAKDENVRMVITGCLLYTLTNLQVSSWVNSPT